MSANKQRVFITGGTSALMQKAIGFLPKSKFHLLLLTRSSNRQITEDEEWVVGDLMNPDSYESALTSCDLIIHAAAVTHAHDEKQYFEVNLEGTKALLRIAKKKPHARFVFISSRTASVESGAYGHSKWLAEQEVRRSGLQHAIIRPAEIFGGDKLEGIDKAIAQAMNGSVQLCPTGVPSPMYPIHVDDAARMIAGFVCSEVPSGSTLYVNGNRPYSFKEVILEVSRVCRRKIIVVPIPRPIMQLVAIISRRLPGKLGIVPDQVQRLYSIKQHGQGAVQTIYLRDHILSLCRNQTSGAL
jgi:NADH dehydrogenase